MVKIAESIHQFSQFFLFLVLVEQTVVLFKAFRNFVGQNYNPIIIKYLIFLRHGKYN